MANLSISTLDSAPLMISNDDATQIKTELARLQDLLFLCAKEDGITAEKLRSKYEKKHKTGLEMLDFESKLQRMNIVTIELGHGVTYLKPNQSFTKRFLAAKKRALVDPLHLYGRDLHISELLTAEIAFEPIPKVALHEHVTIGSLFEAFISEVHSPGNFHIQLRSSSRALTSLMLDLDKFYSSRDSNNYTIPYIMPGLCGLPIAAIYYDKSKGTSEGWHRAVVKKLVNIKEVTVFFIDFGSVSTIGLNSCRFLHRRFASLEAQAVNVKCGGIRAQKLKKGQSGWAPLSSARFHEFAYPTNVPRSTGTGIVAQVMSLDGYKNRPQLICYDTVTNDIPKGINLNDVLIKEGLAAKDPAWIKQGLLPWEYPALQRESIKHVSNCAPNVGSSVDDSKQVEPEENELANMKVVPIDIMQQSVAKVSQWLNCIDPKATLEDDLEGILMID